MKNKVSIFAVMLIALSLLVMGCSSDNDDNNANGNNNDGNKKIDELSIGFVPSRDPDDITSETEPMKDLLIDELADLGYDVEKVDITVQPDYEATGEALSAGTLDVGLIPGGTYVLYDDGAEVLLTATRAGLSIDSDDAEDWNENKPTEPTDEQVTYYRALAIAGPSEQGQAIADKINNGEKPSWDDLDDASWGVMSSSSPAGYIYPALWLKENYDGNTITNLENVAKQDSYGSAFARLANEQLDVVVTYADGRRDYEEQWEDEFERSDSIWDETDVIGVTPGIYNDTVSVSKESDIMDDDFKEALQEAFMSLPETEEGREVIEIYQHEGYQEAESSDYDDEREAQKLVQEMD